MLRIMTMILNNLKKVMEDYKPDYSIWGEDDEDMLLLKSALDSLEDADRIIFILYAEWGSLRKVGKRLGVSHSIIYKNISRIKRQIYDYIKANCTDSDSVLLYRFERIFADGEEVDMEVADGEGQL